MPQATTTKNRSNNILSSLIDVDDSVLVVIDVQDCFVNKLSIETRESLLERIVWLMRVATLLEVPLVVTAEDMPNCGTVSKPVLDAMMDGNNAPKIHNKMVFGLADEPSILSAIRQHKRKTAILVGLETDVCVAHSALGLLARGYHQVAVVQDATGSPGHDQGLERMRSAGVVICTVKSLYYEWVRTVARDNEIKERLRNDQVGTPGSIVL